jgi:DNA polymerase (family X)
MDFFNTIDPKRTFQWDVVRVNALTEKNPTITLSGHLKRMCLIMCNGDRRLGISSQHCFPGVYSDPKGIESDILADGSLDYAENVLERFDFVVASIHGRFKLDRKAQTQRLLRAISHPHTTIIGYMTGRQLQRRPGYEIDVEKVLGACAKDDVVVEIKAHPWRLDLDWRWHQAALEFGCMLSINPDAHSIPELDHMHWGVEMTRKGGVPADRVLNAMTLPEITRYLRQKRRSFARAA